MGMSYKDAAQRVAKGFCCVCPNTIAEGSKSRCESCLNKAVLSARAYIQNGLCRQGCGQDLATRAYCRPCADKRSAVKRAKTVAKRAGAL